MCEIKTVIIVAVLLLAADGFYTYQVNPKWDNIEKSKVKLLAKKSTKYYENGGECYYLVDEDILACNCTWLYGRKRCEKYMWWT